MVSSYKNCGKKRGENASWRKVSTSPRKKSGHLSSQSWNKQETNTEGKVFYLNCGETNKQKKKVGV